MRILRARLRVGRLRLAAGLALIVALVVAIPVIANLPGSDFDAGDGNLVLNDEAKDWANAPNLKVGLDQPTGQHDDSFGQGTKEDTEVPSVVDGSIPNNKSDLTRFYVANERVSGKEFLYLAWERVQEPNGTTNMDFEFNQSTTLSSNGVTPVRTAGDVLIKYDLSQGGVNPVLGFHRWVTTGTPSVVCEASNTVPCWGPVQSLGGNFEGSINTVPVTDPIPPNAPRTLSARTFGEAAINLTDSGILPSNTCTGFGRAYLKSRSSDSFTSAVKDFIAPIAVDIRNCGQIIIHKQTDPDGAPGSFGFTTTGGLDPATFSLSDNGTRDFGGTVQAGSYSVTESDPTPAFDLTDISCTATGSGTSFTKDVGSRTVAMTLAADGVIECTYTNTQRGHIKIDKVTDPGGSLQAFAFALTGGPSALNQSFTLTDASTPHDSGAILPGSGYSAAETVPTGWDLTSATCDDNSPVTNISVSAGETVTCTFNDRARGAVAIHKTDDAGHALAGATFELFTDNAPLDGAAPHGAEDTATGKTCTTNASGDCTIDDVVPGPYWIVETVTPAGHDSAADHHVTVTAGETVSVTLENPRRFKIIVLVCRDSDNTLYPSTVTVDGTDKTSLAAGGGGTLADADLCALGGASYDGKHTGGHPANVSIPVNP